MSFQAYLDAVKAKTGLDPEGILALAKARGVYAADETVLELINMLNYEFDIGLSQSLSICAVFKTKGWVKG